MDVIIGLIITGALGSVLKAFIESFEEVDIQGRITKFTLLNR